VSRLASSISAKAGAWAAFGVVGLATGTVWASGFATSDGANRVGGTVESPALVKSNPAAATSALATKAAPVDPLEFDWDGRWGSINASTVLFKVDLSGAQFTGKTYNIATLLANTSDLAGWASLQLEFELVQKNAGGTCNAADFDGTVNAKLLNVDNQDAGVYWTALDDASPLAGNKVYCVGINQAHGDDIHATFLRSANDTPPDNSHQPKFITTVDRVS
jgi:hypothetical protein